MIFRDPYWISRAANLLLFKHGIGPRRGKIRPSDGFTQGIADMGFPAPQSFAWAAGLLEFGGDILLALGLMTRPASLLIGVTMLVVAFIRHVADPFMHIKTLAISGHYERIGPNRCWQIQY